MSERRPCCCCCCNNSNKDCNQNNTADSLVKISKSRGVHTMTVKSSDNSTDTSSRSTTFDLLTSTPIIIGLIVCLCAMLYNYVKDTIRKIDTTLPTTLPRMKKQDMSLSELRKYDGTQPDGRILVAVNGIVFDVTRGRKMYGPGGPYASFAGHDASRSLAMFQTDMIKDEDDDLSDLNSTQMDSIKEWAAQLSEKFDLVGRLLKPGEEPQNYSDEEEGDQKTDSEREDD